MGDIIELKKAVQDLRVLFVDDEDKIRVSTKVFLNKFFDDVVVCKDGKEGLDTFKSTLNNPNEKNLQIIIADIQMPKINGIDMVKSILKLDSSVYVAFISATKENINDGELKNFLSIQKPISYNSIIKIIEDIKKKFSR